MKSQNIFFKLNNGWVVIYICILIKIIYRIIFSFSLFVFLYLFVFPRMYR